MTPICVNVAVVGSSLRGGGLVAASERYALDPGVGGVRHFTSEQIEVLVFEIL